MLASWPPVLVASSILVIFTTIGVRWFLRHRSGYKLEHARTDLEKWATPCSLLFSALAIFLAWGIQQDNDRSTRQANIDAAAAAQQQRDLLQRAVSALHNTSDQLKANADASTKAAAILAAERQDQQRRIAMKPDVEVTALAVSQDGYSTPVAVVGHAGVVMKANQNPWKTVPGQKDYGLRIVVANKGRAIMPNGSLTVRCSALDGLGDPIVIPGGSTPAGNAIKARIALIETAAAQAKAEQESTGLKNLDAADAALDRILSMGGSVIVGNEYTFPITNLPLPQFAAVTVLNVDLRPQRPAAVTERSFTIDIEFAGSADARSMVFNVVLKFAD
jgi:hypothetical protein